MNRRFRALRLNKRPTQTESSLSMGRLFPRPPLTATRFLGIFLVVTFVASCTFHPISLKKEVGQLNLEYELPRQKRQTKYVIAIVKPEFADLQAEQGPRPANAFEAALLHKMMMKQRKEQRKNYNFSKKFHGNYKARLIDAMKDSLQELLSKKGFKTKGPYATFDEITYGDKKTIYLASVPSLKLYFDDKITQYECSVNYCSTEGQIQITGELTYKLIEPLTGQALLNRRINLSNFAISKTYRHDVLTKSGKIGSISSNPPELFTNADKVLVEAINEFFAKAMEKLHKLISREEIISFAGDVKQLKKTKRF